MGEKGPSGSSATFIEPEASRWPAGRSSVARKSGPPLMSIAAIFFGKPPISRPAAIATSVVT